MDPKNIDLLYREFVRLQEVLNSYAASSFADFKLLGSIGLILTWEPLAKKISNIKNVDISKDQILFLGFIALSVVFFIIATRDLMKQSIVFFYIQETKYYEEALQNALNIHNSKLFSLSEHWRGWYLGRHRYVSGYFQALTLLCVALFPAIILWRTNRKQSLSYLLFVICLAIVYISSASYFILK